MIHVRYLCYVIGILILILSSTMMIPMVLELSFAGNEWVSFLLSTLVGGMVGCLLVLSSKPSRPVTLTIQEIFLLTTLTWLSLCLVGALPFLFSKNLGISFIDACFESTSGLTTTGATILTNLDQASHGILLWRALLQSIGGIGIILMALTIFPFLRIGGMQLFHSEFSDRSEKILPRVSQISSAIFSIYLLLTIICALCLALAGMPLFDAVCHALSTLSTGGFSTHDVSLSGYASNSLIQVIFCIFMLIGGSTLILLVRFGHGESHILWQDSQIRFYLLLTGSLIALLCVWQYFSHSSFYLEDILGWAFLVISLVTTTGFTLTDYSHFSAFPSILIFFMLFIGGCTGSTSGGIKIFRFQVLYLVARMYFKLIRHPKGVFLLTYNKRPLSNTVIISVFSFLAMYGFSFICLAALFAFCGIDFVQALSCSATALGNVGIQLDASQVSNHTFILLPAIPKMLFILGMILGRLELLTVLVLFTPYFWRE